ncbi:rhodanese-like domain-containing protein [Thioalkalivibrio sp. ALE23]|uniref:rhodanese-like domain-containing protein n=1 Tax=Thioalkalivibrio sp. ALE23 TaxID=1265495 RepID=UPI0003A988CD|nr:rhodanese-like domain-containing protein [Thioalkalivibrio sp. ALE23]
MHRNAMARATRRFARTTLTLAALSLLASPAMGELLPDDPEHASDWMAHSDIDDFEGREAFLKFGYEVVETDELAERIDDYTLVDVRTEMEHEALRIKDSHHADLYDEDFTDQLKALREQTDDPIVAYCNGRTCYKAYNAAISAREAGIEGVKAYDAGILEWAMHAPETVRLMGESVDQATLVEHLESGMDGRSMDPMTFAEMAQSEQTQVFDIRAEHERHTRLFPMNEQYHSMEHIDRLVASIQEADANGRDVLIYDEAGKQVRWVGFVLQAEGIDNFTYMEGGVHRFFRDVVSTD